MEKQNKSALSSTPHKSLLFFILLFATLVMSANVACAKIVNYDSEAAKGTFFNGRVWYASRILVTDADWKSRKYTLMSYVPGSKSEPTKETPATFIPDDDVRLLDGGEKLWIISSWFTGYYSNHSIVPIKMKNRLESISRPFVYKGRPAVIEIFAGKFILQVLSDNKWVNKGEFEIESQKLYSRYNDYIQAVSTKDELNIFFESEGMLYYRKGIPSAKEKNLKSWHKTDIPINRFTSWSSTALCGHPVIFTVANQRKTFEIKGYTIKSREFTETYSDHFRFLYNKFSVHPAGGCNNYALITSSSPRQSVIVFKNGKTTSHYIGLNKNSFSAIKSEIIVGYISLSILVFILSLILRKYSLRNFKTGITIYKTTKVLPQNIPTAEDIENLEEPESGPFIFVKYPSKKSVYIEPKAKGIFINQSPLLLGFEPCAPGSKAIIVSKLTLSTVLLQLLVIALPLLLAVIRSENAFSLSAMFPYIATSLISLFCMYHSIRVMKKNAQIMAVNIIKCLEGKRVESYAPVNAYEL